MEGPTSMMRLHDDKTVFHKSLCPSATCKGMCHTLLRADSDELLGASTLFLSYLKARNGCSFQPEYLDKISIGIRLIFLIVSRLGKPQEDFK